MSHLPPSVREIQTQYLPGADIILYPGDVNCFLPTLPDNSVKLIMTSPPYNLGKVYEDRVSIDEYLAAQAQVISQLYRVLRDDGSICWQVGNYVEDGEIIPLDILFYGIFKKLNLFLRNRIIWHFGHGLHASKRFSGRYETILWFTKSASYTFNLDAVRVPSKYPGKRYYKGPDRGKPSGNPKGKNPSDVWEILAQDWESAFWEVPNVKARHPEKTVQPCQFPVELVERCVLALTNEGDWVLDPYAGVGSALIAAIMHNRHAMGSEKDETYYQIAVGRLNSLFDGTLKLRPLGKPIFVPNANSRVARIPEEWQNLENLP
jgi:adenine-specific DNA-methyltransferase